MTATYNAADLAAMADRIGADLAGHILDARERGMPPPAVADATRHVLACIRSAGEGVLEEGEVAELQSRVVKRAEEIIGRTMPGSQAVN